jgi:hypothetical protein
MNGPLNCDEEEMNRVLLVALGTIIQTAEERMSSRGGCGGVALCIQNRRDGRDIASRPQKATHPCLIVIKGTGGGCG